MSLKMQPIEYVVCPSCESNNLTYYDKIDYEGIILKYNRCKRCDLIFMNPMPSQNWYNSLYASEFWEDKSKKQTSSEVHFNAKQWRKELNWADKFISFLDKHKVALGKGARVLEIGCGYGLIVQSIADHFEGQALGVEPSHKAREFAGSYARVNMVAQNMDQLSEWMGDQPMDMIICSHVLENIVDLDLALTTVRRLLSPNGLFLIDTPNIFFQRAISIYHPYCFCEKSISTLLRKYGLAVIGVQKSGRAKDILLPKFLTILARKREKEDIDFGRIPEDHLFLAKFILGRIWRKITLFKPIKFIDRLLHNSLHPPTSYNSQKLASLMDELTDNS